MALKKVAGKYPDGKLEHRVRDGETLVLSRRCSDGGWNCGNPNVLNFDLPSYPETTGLALLGLQGRSQSELARLWMWRSGSAKKPSHRSPRPGSLSRCAATAGTLSAPPAENKVSSDIMLAALEALGHPDGNYALLRTGGRA